MDEEDFPKIVEINTYLIDGSEDLKNQFLSIMETLENMGCLVIVRK